jgi:hypothetical protein
MIESQIIILNKVILKECLSHEDWIPLRKLIS